MPVKAKSWLRPPDWALDSIQSQLLPWELVPCLQPNPLAWLLSWAYIGLLCLWSFIWSWKCLLSHLPFIFKLHSPSFFPFIHSHSSCHQPSKIVLFLTPFLIFVYPMATFQSLTSLTSGQHCWWFLLYWPTPWHFPFYAINLFVWLFSCSSAKCSLSVLFAGFSYPVCCWSTGTLLSYHSIYSPWKELIYFMGSFPTYMLKMPHIYRPLSCLPWVPDLYFQQSDLQVWPRCPTDA